MKEREEEAETEPGWKEYDFSERKDQVSVSEAIGDM